MLLDQLPAPIVLAPLAGGPSTPRLTSAVSNAGGLGFLASGYLQADQLGEQIEAVRRLTASPFGVNLFAPGSGPADPAAYAAYVQRLSTWSAATGAQIGEPRYSDDDWEAKLSLLAAEPVAAVSFTFGCPEAAQVDHLRAAGSEVWVTVTSVDEARQATEAGVDALVVQGAEAGGHRGSFVDRPGLPTYGLLPLLALIERAVSLPLVASGGIATGGALAAVLCAGAAAAQIGTAFMLSPEAGTNPALRAALRSAGDTGLTRAFTGRLARGIRNGFMTEHDEAAPVAYPEIHYVTAELRRRAREQENAELINLWAGEAHELARELPAAEIVAELVAGARSALRRPAVARLEPSAKTTPPPQLNA
jgi:nitronate monooxygenase